MDAAHRWGFVLLWISVIALVLVGVAGVTVALAHADQLRPRYYDTPPHPLLPVSESDWQDAPAWLPARERFSMTSSGPAKPMPLIVCTVLPPSSPVDER